MEPTGGNSFDVFGGYTVYMLTLAHLHSCLGPFAQKAWLVPHAIIVHCVCAKQDTWLLLVTQLTITIAISKQLS